MSKIKDQLMTDTMTLTHSEANMTDTTLMPTADDGFAQAAAEADRRVIEGEIVKFTDGAWSIGKQPIPAETQFIPVRMRMAWVKWINKKPVEYVWPKPNGFLPARESLDEPEEDGNWPIGLS